LQSNGQFNRLQIIDVKLYRTRRKIESGVSGKDFIMKVQRFSLINMNEYIYE
jgi:hypothetical protein